MRVIKWKDLYHTDFDLGRLFAMNQHWDNGREFLMLNKHRETSALLYLADSSAEYFLEDGTSLSFPRGSVVYIPQGSQYRTRFYACKSSKAETQLIEFEMRDSEGNLFVCSEQIVAVLTEQGSGYAGSFEEAVRIFRAFTFSYGDFKSVLFALLMKISVQHQTQVLRSKTFFPITPAVRYLQKYPYSDICVTELAQMCHISESCFRSLFKQYAGKTPSRYCLDNRIDKAKQLLQSGQFTISEIADFLGFHDPGYFTKVFVKAVGMRPTEYQKI